MRKELMKSPQSQHQHKHNKADLAQPWTHPHDGKVIALALDAVPCALSHMCGNINAISGICHGEKAQKENERGNHGTELHAWADDDSDGEFT